MLIFPASVAVLIFTYIFGVNTGIQFYFFVVLTFAYLGTIYLKSLQRYAVLIMPLAAIAITFILNPTSKYLLSDSITQRLFSLNGIFSVAMILLCFNIFSKEMDEKDAIISDTINELSLKNDSLKDALNKLKKSQKNEKLLTEQADYAKLVQGIAHEFKNPLQLMQGMAELEIEKVTNKSEVKKVFKTILETVDRLNNLIFPLINFLKGTNEKYHMKAIDLNQLMANIVNLSGAACKKNNMHLSLHVDRDENIVVADEHYIAQVFINLILNAIDEIGSNGKIDIHIIQSVFLSKKN